MQLGDTKVAARTLIAAEEAGEGQRLLTWTRDWPLVGAEGPEDWRAAAALLDPAAMPAAGPLARGAALAEESAAARAAIEALLQALPPAR